MTNFEVLKQMPLKDFADLLYPVTQYDVKSKEDFVKFLESEIPAHLEGVVKTTLNTMQCRTEDTATTESENLEWHCIAHWLKCLYDDFLHERIAGEPFPCGCCEKRTTCKSCPPVNFLPLIKKTGVKINFNSIRE